VKGVDAGPDVLDRALGAASTMPAGRTVDVVDAHAQEYEPGAPIDAVPLCAVSQLICSRAVHREYPEAVSARRAGDHRT